MFLNAQSRAGVGKADGRWDLFLASTHSFVEEGVLLFIVV